MEAMDVKISRILLYYINYGYSNIFEVFVELLLLGISRDVQGPQRYWESISRLS